MSHNTRRKIHSKTRTWLAKKPHNYWMNQNCCKLRSWDFARPTNLNNETKVMQTFVSPNEWICLTSCGSRILFANLFLRFENDEYYSQTVHYMSLECKISTVPLTETSLDVPLSRSCSPFSIVTQNGTLPQQNARGDEGE